MQQPGILVQERRFPALDIARRWTWPIWRFVRRQPVGFIAGLVILTLVVLAVFGSYIAPYDPQEAFTGERLAAPSTDHLFGVDEKSRDVFSRIVAGARVSIEVGFIAVAIGIGSGSAIGIISGYFGGWLDMLVQRVMDALLSFPALVLAMVFAAAFQPGMVTAMVAIGIVILPSANRVVRGSVMSIKENVYVEAARTVGATNIRIMIVHILPNVLAPIMVMVSIVMGVAIIVEASLSFLGVGVPPPTVSWGQMISTGRSFMEDAPWLVLAPGIAISIVVLAFNLLGDALRDYFDPSLRGR